MSSRWLKSFLLGHSGFPSLKAYKHETQSQSPHINSYKCKPREVNPHERCSFVGVCRRSSLATQCDAPWHAISEVNNNLIPA